MVIHAYNPSYFRRLGRFWFTASQGKKLEKSHLIQQARPTSVISVMWEDCSLRLAWAKRPDPV
jgi:hypothetical protein